MLETRRECPTVTPRFPKYAEAETRRESVTHTRKKTTSRIRAKP